MKKGNGEGIKEEKEERGEGGRERERERERGAQPLREQNEKEWLSIIRCLNKLEPVLQAWRSAPRRRRLTRISL